MGEGNVPLEKFVYDLGRIVSTQHQQQMNPVHPRISAIRRKRLISLNGAIQKNGFNSIFKTAPVPARVDVLDSRLVLLEYRPAARVS
jgi:hypothetical protein